MLLGNLFQGLTLSGYAGKVGRSRAHAFIIPRPPIGVAGDDGLAASSVHI